MVLAVEMKSGQLFIVSLLALKKEHGFRIVQILTV